MTSGSQRIALAAAVLAGVWVVTYWLWPAGENTRDPGITFDEPVPASAATGEPTSARQALADGLRSKAAPAATDSHPSAGVAPVSTPEQVLPTPPADQQGATSAASSQPTNGGSPSGPSRPSATPSVIAPKFTDYIVRPSDSMPAIAQRVYGKKELWQAIAKANPTVDPQKLKAGLTLRIPVDPNNTQGIPAASAPSAPAGGAVTEYVVASGDTLTGIARSLYGKSTLWPIILDANRDKMKAPQDLRAGMRLTIPPVPGAPAPGAPNIAVAPSPAKPAGKTRG